MIFYWFVIPFGSFKFARWLFHRTQHRMFKAFIVIGFFCFYSWYLWVAIGQKIWLDHLVRGMCAKDGGVKVYETVELTSDLLDNAGRIRIPYKGKNSSINNFYYEVEEHFFLKGDPQMARRVVRIVRKSDEKVIGEKITYGRGGGDLPGPWHGSSFTCPDPTSGLEFESAIFLKGEKK